MWRLRGKNNNHYDRIRRDVKEGYIQVKQDDPEEVEIEVLLNR